MGRDEGGKPWQESGRQLEEVNVDPGFHRAHEDELMVRKILKICRKTAEEGPIGTCTLLVASGCSRACDQRGDKGCRG